MSSIYDLVIEHQLPIEVGILLILLVWESICPFFEFFKKQYKKRFVHLLRNFVLGIINSVMISFLFVVLWVKSVQWTEINQFGILYLINLPSWMHLVGAIVLMDLWMYWWHRLNHIIPFFWKFHKVHHSDPFMDVTTANRFHVGEIFFSSLLRTPILILIGVTLGELVFYEAILFANVQIHHANISFLDKIEKILRIFITTPQMHKVHHSQIVQETNSNYTSLLSIWDRIFRSFKICKNPTEIQFGLEESNKVSDDSVKGLMQMPFKKNKK